jgi:hypothetical protein
MDSKNLSIIRQTFANTVFTHKVQEIAAEKKTRNVLIIKVINLILSGAVLLSLAFQVYILGTIITILEIFFLIVQLSFDFEKQAITHKNSALKYMQLRDKYRSLIVDIMNEEISGEEIISKRDSLQSEYQSISDLSPQTSNEEYKEAQTRLLGKITEGEDFTWSNEEINKFLPENIKIS